MGMALPGMALAWRTVDPYPRPLAESATVSANGVVPLPFARPRWRDGAEAPDLRRTGAGRAAGDAARLADSGFKDGPGLAAPDGSTAAKRSRIEPSAVRDRDTATGFFSDVERPRRTARGRATTTAPGVFSGWAIPWDASPSGAVRRRDRRRAALITASSGAAETASTTGPGSSPTSVTAMGGEEPPAEIHRMAAMALAWATSESARAGRRADSARGDRDRTGLRVDAPSASARRRGKRLTSGRCPSAGANRSFESEMFAATGRGSMVYNLTRAPPNTKRPGSGNPSPTLRWVSKRLFAPT